MCLWVRFSLFHQILLRYDVSVDVAPEVRWLSEDKYKNLKVVVEIDEIVDAEKAAEIELKRRHKALGLLRIVADRGLQVKYFGFSLVCYKWTMPLVLITQSMIFHFQINSRWQSLQKTGQ